MSLNIGDFVIISNPVGEHYNAHGYITYCGKVGSSKYYEVCYTVKDIVKELFCNIWENGDSVGETIELDIAYYRDLKLKELGI